jgi:hypothetical protein
MKAQVKNDTLFKLQPVLSSELSDAEKQVVLEGAEYEIKFFTEADNHHWRLELANAVLGQQKSFTWYVHKADIEIIGADVTVKVLADTVFKQRPVLTIELSDTEKAFVEAGREFELQTYAPAPNGFTKLTLADARLGKGDVDSWYANSADISISGQKITLKVISDTLFKAKPLLANQLMAADKKFIPKHTSFGLQTYSEVEGDYLKVTLAGSSLGSGDRIIWYAFAPDVEIEGTAPNDRPLDHNPAGHVQSGEPGEPLNLPGFQGTYYTNTPILTGGYFTWGQATHGGTRIPVSVEVVYGIIRIAEAMEEIRVLFGNRPIEVNSWYRDPATNLRVGGWAMSRHLYGDAVNFTLEDVSPQDVYTQLDPWWGSRGGLASSTKFTHIDARGYRARWDYGF